MTGSRQTRILITALMNVLIIVAVVLVARIVVDFFGVLAASRAGAALLDSTAFMVPDLGIAAIRTPYGGVLDAEAAIMVVVLLVIEWVLAMLRSRA